MGYTHRWIIGTVAPEQWNQVVRDCGIALSDYDGLCYEYDEPKRPPSFSKVVRFNGKGDDGHETFLLSPEPSEFEFCKTARKHYDGAVCAALIIAKHHLGDEISISSDGSWDEWAEGRWLVKERLSYETDGLDD